MKIGDLVRFTLCNDPKCCDGTGVDLQWLTMRGIVTALETEPGGVQIRITHSRHSSHHGGYVLCLSKKHVGLCLGNMWNSKIGSL